MSVVSLDICKHVLLPHLQLLQHLHSLHEARVRGEQRVLDGQHPPGHGHGDPTHLYHDSRLDQDDLLHGSPNLLCLGLQ